jgi:hypothetical protein
MWHEQFWARPLPAPFHVAYAWVPYPRARVRELASERARETEKMRSREGERSDISCVGCTAMVYHTVFSGGKIFLGSRAQYLKTTKGAKDSRNYLSRAGKG